MVKRLGLQSNESEGQRFDSLSILWNFYLYKKIINEKCFESSLRIFHEHFLHIERPKTKICSIGYYCLLITVSAKQNRLSSQRNRFRISEHDFLTVLKKTLLGADSQDWRFAHSDDFCILIIFDCLLHEQNERIDDEKTCF